MTMSEVGRRDQLVDPVNGGDVAADGTLLSVAEIQHRFREERARRGMSGGGCSTPPSAGGSAAVTVTVTPAASPRPVAASEDAPAVEPEPSAAPRDTGGASGPRIASGPAPPPPTSSTAVAVGGLDLPGAWVRVLAGHSGAGASTIALAIADAAAAAGRPSQLIETAPASRSGLVSAASRELDVDATGAWRCGTRPHPATSAHVTINRRAEDRQPTGWPSTAATSPGDVLVAADLGLVPGDALGRVVGGVIVVACRATIPGVRLTEQLLNRLDESTVVVAMLVARRWPGEVRSSCGPQLRALRAAGWVVTVPMDGHLAVTGPTHLPLPKAVLAAGRALLGLIDAARTGGVSASPNRARSAPRQKGTTP
jgi:hypothetical protein